MKLGIACNHFGFSGGMENYTLNLIKAFHKQGLPHPVVFAKSFDESLQEFSFITPQSIPTFGVPRLFKDFFFSYQLRKSREKFGVDVLLGCCRNDQSEIILCGGTHAGYLSQCCLREGLYDKFCLSLEEKEYCNAKKIIAHSRSIKNELINFYGVNQDKIEVLYPPVDFSIFSRPTEEERQLLRQKFGIKEGTISVLFVSSSHKRKGFELLEKLFENTSLPIELLVAGRPIPKKPYKNIRYLGYLKNIQEAYQAVDLSILASRYEPFGLAPIESLCAGTPVIISANLGAAEVIKTDVKFEFTPNSLVSLEKSLKEAISSLRVTRQLIKKDRVFDLFTENLDPEIHASKIYNFAQKVIR